MVSEKCVMPVEIYGLCDDNTTAIDTHHIQEIIEILHECILSKHITTKKKDESAKQQQQKSGIVTGTSVRIGYVYKRRPGNQLCLVPSSYVIDIKDKQEEEELRSFQVLQEKIIVYAHRLGSGSPNKMSQLVKKVQDKRQSTGSGVSISSYFKKTGSQSCNSQTGSNSRQQTEQSQSAPSENQSEGYSDPQAPPSEGRRHKIKSILKRVDEKVKRRKKKLPSKHTEGSTKAKVFELASSDDSSEDENQGSESINSRKKAAHIKHSGSRRNVKDKESLDKKTLGKEKEDSRNIDQGNEKNSSTELAQERHEYIDLSVDQHKHFEVTESSAKETTVQVEDIPAYGSTKIQLLDVPLVQGKPSPVKILSATADKNLTGDSDCEPQSSSEPDNGCILGDMRVSEVSVPGLKLVPADTAGAGTVTVIRLDQVHALQEDSIQVSSDSDADDSILPTASFLTKPSSNSDRTVAEVNHSVESSDKTESTGDNSPKDSPKFPRKKSSDCVNIIDIDNESSRDVESIPDSPKNASSKLYENKSRLGKLRSKRKFPTFSDSDSDEIVLPAKKVSKVKTRSKTSKFADKETDYTSKNFTFRNKFSEENETKKQTKLSFFTNKENVGSKPQPEDNDMDLELIEELSQTPRIRRETDSILKKEIENIDSVKELNEEHIGYMVGENEKHLRKIFEGKLKCRRHDMYKQGGNSRRLLNHESRMDHYTDEQVDQVMDILMGMFCKRHHKYLDYLTKVLLPEMLIKLHMDIHGTSHHASDNLLGQSSSQGGGGI